LVMKIVVTGSQGMLAQDLVPSLKKAGVAVAGFDLPEVDITRSRNAFHIIESENPACVINCAAYTAVDRAESEETTAFAVNRDGAANLADACHRLDIPFIHISTDFVFNGDSKRPYREDDATDPLSVYGHSKWEGEKAVRSLHDKHIIVRTAWLFGTHGNNFVKSMIRLAREREELRVINDQTGCPTWTGDLAAALGKIVQFLRSSSDSSIWGTYHFCGEGCITWYGFTNAIIEEAGHYERLTVKKVIPITTAQYPTPARRPKWSVLDTGKITTNFGIRPMPWRIGLKEMIKKLYR
jgi:dTDP-4-dehydrorhamnose reductase